MTKKWKINSKRKKIETLIFQMSVCTIFFFIMNIYIYIILFSKSCLEKHFPLKKNKNKTSFNLLDLFFCWLAFCDGKC